MVNSYLDHGCQFGYPRHKRLGRINGIIPLNQSVYYNFTSTAPSKMKFSLHDSNWGIKGK